ncbi:MAG: hypothetical protein JWO58_2394 [Chitinophagaceae bacterium]|nr:hypothetical protein [Chitinophagaceae bacterium]
MRYISKVSILLILQNIELSNDIIWQAITNSAKKRFDYGSFSKEHPFVTDKVLLKIIIDLASRKDKKAIASQVQEKVLEESGKSWNIQEIETFIADKDQIFKREMFATGIFGNMLYEGNELEDMYYEVSKYILI